MAVEDEDEDESCGLVLLLLGMMWCWWWLWWIVWCGAGLPGFELALVLALPELEPLL